MGYPDFFHVPSAPINHLHLYGKSIFGKDAVRQDPVHVNVEHQEQDPAVIARGDLISTAMRLNITMKRDTFNECVFNASENHTPKHGSKKNGKHVVVGI